MTRFSTTILMLSLSFTPLAYGAENCFLRDGDRWSVVGDSITNNGGYSRMARLLLNHFHPEAKIDINGIGVDGVSASYSFSGDYSGSTVVSIMLGTNNVIHHGYGEMDKRRILDQYRNELLAKVRRHQTDGSTVLLLSSPLVDENFGRGWWELRGCNDLIGEFPRILKEIAKETGAHYIPVQEEMELYRGQLQRDFGIVRPLYPDGVHPNGWCQYQIAKTLWAHLAFTGELSKKGEARRLSSAPEPVPVELALERKFLEPGAPLTLRLRADKTTNVELRWSCGPLRGNAALAIPPEGMGWTVPVKGGELDVSPGHNKTLILDLAAGESKSLYAIDITGTNVWHLDKERAVAGDIPLSGPRKQGAWKISKHDHGLLLSGTVADTDIQDGGTTYSSGDGVQITLDLRQNSRFGDLAFDEDVHLLCLNVQREPLFGVGIVPVWGRGMSFAGQGAASETAEGYAWHFFISHGFKDQDKPFDIERSDYVGFNIDIVDRDLEGNGKHTQDWIKMVDTDFPVQNFPAFLQLLDMKNQLKGDKVRMLNLMSFTTTK